MPAPWNEFTKADAVEIQQQLAKIPDNKDYPQSIEKTTHSSAVGNVTGETTLLSIEAPATNTTLYGERYDNGYGDYSDKNATLDVFEFYCTICTSYVLYGVSFECNPLVDTTMKITAEFVDTGRNILIDMDAHTVTSGVNTVRFKTPALMTEGTEVTFKATFDNAIYMTGTERTNPIGEGTMFVPTFKNIMIDLQTNPIPTAADIKALDARLKALEAK